MTHHMNLKSPPFSLIASGKKTIELRLWDEKRQKIAPGDTIVFTNAADTTQQIACSVEKLHLFADFPQLYEALPLDKCGYLPQEIPNASPADMDIYYPAQKQRQYGVVGIELRLL